ncbi:Platelet basic protein, partial [Heterocephalus glaber]
MSLRFNATSCSSPSLHLALGGLLLLSLLLTVLVPSTNGQGKTNLGKNKAASIESFVELRCLCVKTVSGIHPSKISTLEMIKAGSHCSKVQVIATLKEGQKVCLNPDAPGVKKMIQKTLEGQESA